MPRIANTWSTCADVENQRKRFFESSPAKDIERCERAKNVGWEYWWSIEPPYRFVTGTQRQLRTRNP
jgi:hypothetical protein